LYANNGLGLVNLITFGLDRFVENILKLPRSTTKMIIRRYILAGHSGGGRALVQLVSNNIRKSPEEVYVYDALYWDSKYLIDWIKSKVANDTKIVSNLPNDCERLKYMKTSGSALRIYWMDDTDPVTQTVLPYLPAKDTFLSNFYRAVKDATVEHNDIPKTFGPSLLYNVTGSPYLHYKWDPSVAACKINWL